MMENIDSYVSVDFEVHHKCEVPTDDDKCSHGQKAQRQSPHALWQRAPTSIRFQRRCKARIMVGFQLQKQR